MDDIFSLIAVVLAVLVGFGLAYLYNHRRDEVLFIYKGIKALYKAYEEDIKRDNPELVLEINAAIAEMDKAFEDDTITDDEAFDIIKKFKPLMTRLLEFIRSRYDPEAEI